MLHINKVLNVDFCSVDSERLPIELKVVIYLNNMINVIVAKYRTCNNFFIRHKCPAVKHIINQFCYPENQKYKLIKITCQDMDSQGTAASTWDRATA